MNQKGITLIALVVTIVVLLILAGVSISMLTGKSGIITNAQKAKETMALSEIKEAVDLILLESKINNTLSTKSGTLEEVLGTNKYNNYSEKLYLLGGNLVYDITKCSTKEIEDMQTVGIKSIEEYKTIRSVEELKAFRDEVNNGESYEGRTVYLINDLTLDITEEWIPIGSYPNASQIPDDEANKPFKGIFDGCGNEINGIYINTTNKAQALFGIIGGTIRNLGIGKDCSIKGGAATAGLLGYAYKGSTVENCYNIGELDGENGNCSTIIIPENNYSKTAKNIYALENEGYPILKWQTKK